MAPKPEKGFGASAAGFVSVVVVVVSGLFKAEKKFDALTDDADGAVSVLAAASVVAAESVVSLARLNKFVIDEAGAAEVLTVVSVLVLVKKKFQASYGTLVAG